MFPQYNENLLISFIMTGVFLTLESAWEVLGCSIDNTPVDSTGMFSETRFLATAPSNLKNDLIN